MAGTKNVEIVIGEGITEVYYFTSIRDTIINRPTAKSVKPYNMEELEKAIKKYANEGYTKIHCLIDMDTKVAQSKTRNKYLQLKQKYDGKIVKKTECMVHFYESFPSIEIFFYYYFDGSTAEKTNDGLKSWLKDRCGYDVSERFFNKHSLHGTFVSNGGCLRNAIINAKKSVKLREDNNFNCSYTEVGDLIEYLGIK